MARNLMELLSGNRVVLLDGGMGRMLQSLGLGIDSVPESCNVTHPEQVEGILRAYVEAGSEIIYTNTFGCSRVKLRRTGWEERVVELNQAAVKVARAAAQDRALVAGDIASTGEMLEPYGDLTHEEAYQVFLEQTQALQEAGVDLFVVETMWDVVESELAVRAIQSISDKPIICTLTFGANGRTMMGTTPEAAAQGLTPLGLAAIGANCSTGAGEMVPVIRAMAQCTKLPLVAKPNAGMPELLEGKTVFPHGPEEMAKGVRQLIEAGAKLVGGCCGSSPDHIRAIRNVIAQV